MQFWTQFWCLLSKYNTRKKKEQYKKLSIVISELLWKWVLLFIIFYLYLENQNFGATTSKYKSRLLHIALFQYRRSNKQNPPFQHLEQWLKLLWVFFCFVGSGLKHGFYSVMKMVWISRLSKKIFYSEEINFHDKLFTSCFWNGIFHIYKYIIIIRFLNKLNY